jgi:O-antigen/teichoic acid export membrane protein
LVLIIAGTVVRVLFPSLVRGLDTTALIIVLACLPAALGVGFLHSILLGEGRAVSYNLIDITLAAGTLSGLAVGFGVFDMGVTGAIAVTMAPFWAGVIIYLVLQLRHAPPVRSPDLRLMRAMLKYGFRIYVATLFAFLVIRADILLVNSYLGSSDTGLYAVAVSMGDTLYILPTVFALNLFPRIARGNGSEMTGQVFRAVAVLYFAVCAISIPLASPAVTILYGHSFQESAHLFYVLLPGIYALGLLTVLAYHFSGQGFPIEAMLVWIPGLVLNLAINLLFLHDGVYIAALASSIAYTLLLVLHIRLFARTSGGYRELVPRPAEIVDLFVATRGLLRRRAIV